MTMRAEKILSDGRTLASVVADAVDDSDLANMVLNFFEEGENSFESFSNDDDNNEEENPESTEQRKAYWDLQHQLLKEALYRTTSMELKIRKDTEQFLVERVGPICACGKKTFMGVCRNCLLRDVTDRLRSVGYDTAICKSKWHSSLDIPAGEHSYIDVIATTTSTKKTSIRVVIELDFRAEFEMARGSPEYKRLIDRLPQVFVGKPERLKNLLKILCGAAKKSMKENKMHMGPWRKHKYMQAKWFGTYERTHVSPLFSLGRPNVTQSESESDRNRKLRASMLTFDLLDNLPSMHCTAVEVV